MLSKLLQRLDALTEAAEAIRTKATGKDARKIDGLAVAKALLAVDAAATKLGGLVKGLAPTLFDQEPPA